MAAPNRIHARTGRRSVNKDNRFSGHSISIAHVAFAIQPRLSKSDSLVSSNDRGLRGHSFMVGKRLGSKLGRFSLLGAG